MDFVRLVLRTSSVHGLSQIAARNRHPSETVVWIVTSICGLYGAIWLCQSTMHRFEENPTVISLERNYKEWNTTFPASTICPKTKTKEDIENVVSKWFPSADNATEAERWLRDLSNATYTNFAKMENYSPAIRPENYLDAVLDAKLQFRYVLSNSNSDAADLVPTFTELGLCYSYNSQVAIYNNPEYWRQNNFTFVEVGDLFKGNPLEGDIFAQVMEMNSGFKVFVHSPSEVAEIASSSRESPPKFYMSLDLVALTIYSTEQTKSLRISQRKCRFLDEGNLKISPAYTYKLCRIECRMKLANRLCGCVPYFYRKTDLKICDVNGMLCLAKYKERLLKLLHDGVKEQCQCVPPCNDVNYSIHGDSLSPWFLGTNFKYGLIKYPRSRLKRDVFFSFNDLLIQFGGTVGLCLGCSVLSCIEFVYFFTLRLFLFVTHKINENKRFPHKHQSFR
ncbi:sodium channel protein Nach-like [Cimex lectularius]|uniref:Sodium channel protein Nach n=1 Tax=Cimex lectularius TaxID=79782 RepID=A0A8I6RJP6_CIMLE|nr:sodium channel protein Nach-like [Cimex lectularius]